MTRYVIRNLTIDDIPSLMALPRSESREMGLEPEFETWLKFDPQGIFIAVDDDENVAGCCSGMKLSESHGYLGLYVVREKHRGAGLGRMLWNAAINHLGDRNISLSSVEKMVNHYGLKGFNVVADWTIDLYRCRTPVLPRITPVAMPFTLPVDNNLIHHVLDYDRRIHSYDRSRAVESTIKEYGSLTLVAVKPLQPTISGYSCIKKGLQGNWLIAPIYADDYYTAYALLNGLISSLSQEQREQGIVAKLVSSNTDAAELMQLFGFTKTTYNLRRCSTKEVVSLPIKNIFALQTSVFCTE